MSVRMAATGNRLLAVLITTTLILSPLAEAKRLGGGRSTGSQRSMPRNAAPAQQQAAPAPQQAPAQQPQKSGVGTALAGAAAGAAVGGVAGYMMGKSANASGAAQGESSFPWGWMLLLGALTIGGVMWMRRRNAQQPQAGGYAHAVPAGAANWQSNQPPQANRVFRMGEGATSAAAPVAVSNGRLPDGTESAAFLRQARASFLHMQAMNSPEQLEELRKYLTPALFEELKADIGGNQDLAEFPELNVELADTGTDNGQLYASARFRGRVSESLNAPAVPFEEVWHFVKPRADDPRWLLAGIQQS
ncbi:hypothetical protein IGB42_02118 [Andreprevotia sp. IGB-42]|uniref:Tim44 domain-containing protein n=1 Tax=Andreprevotia sp. IGB-42 TaxID=2497473 RepID=UPI00157F5DC1|nr:Tim44-like domain-containing protein [Andreprevotia sp. IGB-42]KAF0813190.1 hypothetical protein IGB42_02118 [Andreprevotia sp. IGB-42]